MDLVSVIIPAYNAQATIDETLRSIRAQTHPWLQIIVVDDGSIDATASIIAAHMDADTRVRLIRQRNEGVAAARNRGARAASSDILSFVDADDLCAPQRIEKQLAALRSYGDRAALVYTWSALIDGDSLVIGTHRSTLTGNVLKHLCRENFVGNGSSAMMRKAAFEEAGGYDSSLRERKAEGCEDLALYIQIAERHEFAVAPELLTGYRQGNASMSSDVLQMFESWKIVSREAGARNPQLSVDLDAGEVETLSWLMGRAVKNRRFGAILRLGGMLFLRAPLLALAILVRYPVGYVCRRLPNPFRAPDDAAKPVLQRFVIGDVADQS